LPIIDEKGKGECIMILKVRLKEILQERGMTQKELSELSGLRPNTISELAKNIRESINRKHLGKIAETLNIKDPNELLYFEEDKTTT
jgi:putative transcriptional regulator